MEREFKDLKRDEGEISRNDCENIAKSCLISVEDVSMWMGHLEGVKQRRRMGAIKAQQTRMAGKKQDY